MAGKGFDWSGLALVLFLPAVMVGFITWDFIAH